MICMSFLILAVYAIGFVCALDALDGSFCNLIFFAQFGDLASQRHALVCQFRRCFLSAHLLDDLGTLCSKVFYLPGQALAVINDCLQGCKAVVFYKGVFCKDSLSVFPNAL